MRLCLRMLIPCVALLTLLCCASTPAPQPDQRDVEMLAEIQKKRGERSFQIASRLLQQVKAVEMKSGKRAAYDYLMRIGYRWPYEAVTIRKTLFPELARTGVDDELQMLADIQVERGERNALVAYKYLHQAKAVNMKAGKQRTIEYLMKVGANYPYEAMKIRETLFPEKKTTIAKVDDAVEQSIAKAKEQALSQGKSVKSQSYTPRLEPMTAVTKEIHGKKFRKKFALVIGISNYKHQGKDGLTNLLFADDDAIDFSDALGKLGWSSSHVKKLINRNATKRNIEIALESWLTKAGENDLIVVFWAGHGFPDPEDPQKVYFACYDTELSIPATGYRMDRVRQSLEERSARNVLFFGDTCHAGKLITRGERQNAIAAHLKGLRQQKKIPKGWIFMVGAETDRYALESSSWSNGAFTFCLVAGMLGKADGFESIGPKDGIVTMRELQAYLNSAMPDKTQKALGVAKRPLITTTTGDPGIWDLSLTE